MSIRLPGLASLALMTFAVTGDVIYRANEARKFWSAAAAEQRRLKGQRANLLFHVN